MFYHTLWYFSEKSYLRMYLYTYVCRVSYLEMKLCFKDDCVMCVLSCIVQVTDSFALISADSSKVKFIWSSERSGFSHLELIEATLTFPPATRLNRYLYQASVTRRPLTKGPWVVMPTEVRHISNSLVPIPNFCKNG